MNAPTYSKTDSEYIDLYSSLRKEIDSIKTAQGNFAFWWAQEVTFKS